mgnify:CR=1 FL=1
MSKIIKKYSKYRNIQNNVIKSKYKKIIRKINERKIRKKKKKV